MKPYEEDRDLYIRNWHPFIRAGDDDDDGDAGRTQFGPLEWENLFELVPGILAIRPNEEEEGSHLRFYYDDETLAPPKIVIGTESSEPPNYDREIRRLIRFAEHLPQRLRYWGYRRGKVDAGPIGAEDFFSIWDDYVDFWRDGSVSNPLTEVASEAFYEDHNLFIAGLLGYFFRYYERGNKLDQETRVEEKVLGSDRATQVSLALVQYLTHLHFAREGTDAVADIYRYHIQKNRESFTESLNNFVKITGLHEDVAWLRVARSGKNIKYAVFAPDEVKEGEFTLCDPTPGVEAVEGIDGTGKGSMLAKTSFLTLPISHPYNPDFIDKCSRIFFDKPELLVHLENIGRNAASARQQGDTQAYQESLVEVRYRIAEALGAGRVFYLSSKGVLSERSLMTNIAYAINALDFLLKFLELGRLTYFPEKIYYISLPPQVAYQRAGGRLGQGQVDEFDAAEFSIYQLRDFRYRLLAHLLPEIFVFLPTYERRPGGKIYFYTPSEMAKILMDHYYQRNNGDR